MEFLVKTDSGREALSGRSSLLRARDRQMLVLANGKRSVAEVLDLMGKDAAGDLNRLVSLGLLKLVRLADAKAAAVEVPAPATDRTPAVEEDPSKRRAVAAFKMYLMDMLQMLRSSESSALASELQQSPLDRNLMPQALQALKLMHRIQGIEHAIKVAGHLMTLMPGAQGQPLADFRNALLQPPPQPEPAVPRGVRPEPEPPAIKRSLAGTKMYVADMLQRMRSPDASAHSSKLHLCANEAELINHVVDVLSYVETATGRSYALRMACQLMRVVPEAHLPRISKISESLGDPEPAEQA